MLALVESESSLGAYVCHRRPGGSIAISDLVDVCMCVCVPVCHSGRCEGLSRCRLVGSCVHASWRGFLYKGLHVKPRLHAWHSHRQPRSHFAFLSLSDQWEIRLFFHFSKLSFTRTWVWGLVLRVCVRNVRVFCTKLPFPLPWWSKDLLMENLQVAGGQLRNPPV